MAYFNFLHFSDIHFGDTSQEWLWPNFREQLFEDLARLSDSSGPWHFVMITGDIAQKGTADDYIRATEELSKLWDHFKHLGSNPYLFLVPGNHDLTRPNPLEPEIMALTRWEVESDLRTHFWQVPNNKYISAIAKTFDCFTQWQQSIQFAPKIAQQNGIIPGDFSATLRINGLDIGIVGLNTSYLQLLSGDYQGKLSLDVRQLNAICKNGFAEWSNEMDLTLLLSHHSPKWLNPSSMSSYDSEIYMPDRFFAHYCGHLHKPDCTNYNQAGSPTRRLRQAPSIFGLKYINNGEQVERVHGYNCCRFDIEGGSAAEYIWPRAHVKRYAGNYTLAPDNGFELNEDNAVVTHFQPKRLRNLIKDDKTIPQKQGLSGYPSSIDDIEQPETTPITSILEKTQDATIFSDYLKHIPRFQWNSLSQHFAIRRHEQALFEAHLLQLREVWLTCDWGLGKETFLGCVFDNYTHKSKCELSVFRVQCEDAATYDDLLQLIQNQFAISLQQFCFFAKDLTNIVLLLDEVSPSLATIDDKNKSISELSKSIRDYCPNLGIVIVSRVDPPNPQIKSVRLFPLDLPDIRAYIQNHPNVSDLLAEPDAIDILFRRSGGLLTYLDRILDSLKFTSLSTLLEHDDNQLLESPSDDGPSRALVESVQSLSRTTDRYSKRSYKLLKVLTVLYSGQTFESIRRFFPTEPFHMQNVQELSRLSLLEVIPLQATPSLTTICPTTVKYSSSTIDPKLLRVPRQVRDYVKKHISKREYDDIISAAADILFGPRWKEGAIRESFQSHFISFDRAVFGPGNEHVVICHLLNNANQLSNENLQKQGARLGIAFCQKLIDEDRFHDALIALEEITHLIMNSSLKYETSKLFAMHGYMLRMNGKTDRAIKVLEEALHIGEDVLPNDDLSSVHMDLAFIYYNKEDRESGDNSIQYVQKLTKRGSARFMQAEAERIEHSDDLDKIGKLIQIEKRARNKEYHTVANNIALTIANRLNNAKSLQMYQKVINGKHNAYNQYRAAVDKVEYLARTSGSISSKDINLLNLSYSFLFSQRLTPLFNRCHSLLWAESRKRNAIGLLLGLFRHSSFLWRISGQTKHEHKFLKELVNLTENKNLKNGDKALESDIYYLEVRRKELPVENTIDKKEIGTRR